jgi:hypothetical protein
MDRAPDQWELAESEAQAELSRLFRQWKANQPHGKFGVMVRTEGARGPQFITPTEEPDRKI